MKDHKKALGRLELKLYEMKRIQKVCGLEEEEVPPEDQISHIGFLAENLQTSSHIDETRAVTLALAAHAVQLIEALED